VTRHKDDKLFDDPENGPDKPEGDAVVDDQGATQNASPSPPSTPGMPVPHAAAPAMTSPTPPTTPGMPVQSWLIP
jgi:hypothetical protein